MNKVIHFEIPVNEPEKMINFYEKVFDWEVSRWEGQQTYWLITAGEEGSLGINGGFFKPTETFNLPVNTIEVSNLDEYIGKVKSNGGSVVVDKMAIPGIVWQCYCKDIEGILFGMHQQDANAK